MVERWSPKPKVGSSSPPTRADTTTMNKIIAFLKESYHEIKYKVTWPPISVLEQMTYKFFTGLLVFGLLLLGSEQLLQYLQEEIYKTITSKYTIQFLHDFYIRAKFKFESDDIPIYLYNFRVVVT